MKKIEIVDEENTLIIEDQYDITDFVVFPKEKKFEVNRSVKDDCFFSNQIYEYRISVNPPKLEVRLLESSTEPPKEYSVKDGVVLESEIVHEKDGFFLETANERVISLKKEIEWKGVDLLSSCELNLFILSKHQEIISKEEYRKLLRKNEQRIKSGLAKIEEFLRQKDQSGLQILDGEYGKYIWYPKSEEWEMLRNEYVDLPEEKRSHSKYGKSAKYVENLNASLFKEDSQDYCGISKYEFGESFNILQHLEKLLENKMVSHIKNNNETGEPSKMKVYTLSLLITFLLSWVCSLVVDVNPFLIFLLVQGISFVQALIGPWIASFFE